MDSVMFSQKQLLNFRYQFIKEQGNHWWEELKNLIQNIYLDGMATVIKATNIQRFIYVSSLG